MDDSLMDCVCWVKHPSRLWRRGTICRDVGAGAHVGLMMDPFAVNGPVTRCHRACRGDPPCNGQLVFVFALLARLLLDSYATIAGGKANNVNAE
jgi:hypothetical protein